MEGTRQGVRPQSLAFERWTICIRPHKNRKWMFLIEKNYNRVSYDNEVQNGYFGYIRLTTLLQRFHGSQLCLQRGARVDKRGCGGGQNGTLPFLDFGGCWQRRVHISYRIPQCIARMPRTH